MRFGISGGLLPNRVDDFSEETARTVRGMGFTGIFTRFDADDPFATTDAQCRRVRKILDDHGLRMVQAIGHRPPLIHPDEDVRKRAVEVFRQAIRIAGALGAITCHSGPGSMAQMQATGSAWKGAWDPHPENWSPRCREQLVKSLRESCAAAEDHGTLIGLEGHVLSTLSSAEVMRVVIDAVGSPAVKCDFDPVNWITLTTVYHSGPAIDHMADLLGDRIANAHAKDVVLESRLTTHIDERPAGTGLLDFGTFMRRMEALGPDRFLVVEHCTNEEIPTIKAFLDRKAAELGIRVF